MPRKKTEEPITTEETAVLQPADASEDAANTSEDVKAPQAGPATKAAPSKKTAPSSILTLDADAEIETQETREDTIWHELQNAYRTRKILPEIWVVSKKWKAAAPLPLFTIRRCEW